MQRRRKNFPGELIDEEFPQTSRPISRRSFSRPNKKYGDTSPKLLANFQGALRAPNPHIYAKLCRLASRVVVAVAVVRVASFVNSITFCSFMKTVELSRVTLPPDLFTRPSSNLFRLRSIFSRTLQHAEKSSKISF